MCKNTPTRVIFKIKLKEEVNEVRAKLGSQCLYGWDSYFVRKKVEFSLLLVKVTGRSFNVMFIFCAQAVSFFVWKQGR